MIVIQKVIQNICSVNNRKDFTSALFIVLIMFVRETSLKNCGFHLRRPKPYLLKSEEVKVRPSQSD